MNLNPAQRTAATFGITDGMDPGSVPPLLIIAGAGSGKTQTLAHRVAELILHGADPQRILLMTFTRRASTEMIRRAQRVVAQRRQGDPAQGSASDIRWAGTYHAVANRLLRLYSGSLELDASFTVLDRSDAADLIGFIRNEMGLSRKSKRFPKKDTCLAIYSMVVNTQKSLDEVLAASFPWCEKWPDELRELCARYVQAKQEQAVLDYDDLLLYWYHLMQEPSLAEAVSSRFDYVLVDEYQDTNVLQAEILYCMKPNGNGVSVVGDDAQSIYSFRAASVDNILTFPDRFEQKAEVVTLEQNYRSTQPILAACNAVMEQATQRYRKALFSERASQEKPVVVTAEDEPSEVDFVVEQILFHREAGIDLHRQAVLFRTAHHSDQLEIELGRRNIPFVKYGGLKFLEAAHVKDLLSVLRWAENPRDSVAAFRVLQLLPGLGPTYASRIMQAHQANALAFEALATVRVPAAAAEDWPHLARLMLKLRDADTAWHAQVGLVRKWYQPHLVRLYESAHVRAGDLEQLESISGNYPSRERFLTELTLDPPDASGDKAGVPLLDEDYLILSTIHSAKGQEWDVVYILHAADGCIPSDMSTGSQEQIEEERRLLYVAMTRARDHLYLIHPHRFYVRQQHRHGRRHIYTPRTRFLPPPIMDRFTTRAHGSSKDKDQADSRRPAVKVNVSEKLIDMWRNSN
ncbi:MAG: ATP-dependent helicase [Verrucomicrobia bacterium]|nr:ATP-dependent helicase [Verrucomicrobiota bacterium]MDA1087651.1 ATP-dependent helicase [Verrucomicrobiota bacterium]